MHWWHLVAQSANCKQTKNCSQYLDKVRPNQIRWAVLDFYQLRVCDKGKKKKEWIILTVNNVNVHFWALQCIKNFAGIPTQSNVAKNNKETVIPALSHKDGQRWKGQNFTWSSAECRFRRRPWSWPCAGLNCCHM